MFCPIDAARVPRSCPAFDPDSVDLGPEGGCACLIMVLVVARMEEIELARQPLGEGELEIQLAEELRASPSVLGREGSARKLN